VCVIVIPFILFYLNVFFPYIGTFSAHLVNGHVILLPSWFFIFQSIKNQKTNHKPPHFRNNSKIKYKYRRMRQNRHPNIGPLTFLAWYRHFIKTEAGINYYCLFHVRGFIWSIKNQDGIRMTRPLKRWAENVPM
jgi:hypothetical protein